jgi:hypothetical protein
MSNNRNLGNIATAITNATSGQVLTSQGSGVATFADAGGGVTYYANVSDLPDSGNSNGDAAFVGANNRLYVFNGVGWYSVALLNQTPTISSVADAGSNTTPFTLSSSGTATVITITATDAEGDALTYNYSVSSGALNGSTVAQGTGAAYAIASASLLSGTMSISSVNGALTFKPDGTKMYTLTTNNDTIGQYDLSTAWDVSTATYNGAFNTQSQVANLTDVKFNTDGTKMFVADRYGTTSNTIYQYTLSTAWDATTASYANKSYDFTSVLTGNDLNCFVFNADGTSVYLAEHQSSSNIYQFTLSTAFDISTASYASKTLSLSSVASNSYIGRQYFQFTNDGSKLFVIHTFHPSGFVGKVYEFSLTTAYDISTASYTNVNYAPSGITASRSALAFKPDGTKMFILGTDNHTTISQFNLPIYGANQFTVTPHASNAATFGLTFTVTDGINTATSTSQSFTLEFDMTGTQQARLISSDAAAWDNQGWEVDIDGDTAVVGTRNKEAVYVYVRSGTSWSQQAKLTASDGVSGDQFGIDVGVSGDYIVVGANQDDDAGTNSGSAYVFVRSGTSWSQQQKLTASNAGLQDGFGTSVDIDGSSVLVGAPFEDTGGTNFGAAYVFTRSGTTWSQQQQLPLTGTSGEYFGAHCAIEGDNAVVGGYGHNPSEKGRAFVYTRSGTTWTQQAALNASDAANYDRFGHGVSISGDTIVCGAYQEDTTASDAGAVYIFTRSGTTWSQQQKIQSSDIAANDNFGFSVAVDGDTLIAGARYQDTGSSGAGAAYIFTRSGTTWTQAHKIQASTVTTNGYFGSAVALSDKTGIVGEYLLEHNSVNSGGAYIFV